MNMHFSYYWVSLCTIFSNRMLSLANFEAEFEDIVALLRLRGDVTELTKLSKELRFIDDQTISDGEGNT